MAPFFFGGLYIRELVLCDSIGGRCLVTLTFVFVGKVLGHWMSGCCYFVPIKRFNSYKMPCEMRFVPLKTFCQYSFGRERVE